MKTAIGPAMFFSEQQQELPPVFFYVINGKNKASAFIRRFSHKEQA